MGGLRITLTIIFLVAGAILSIVIMMQESKQRGLSATLTGSGMSDADSYWAKNKGRSVEGKLVIWSRILLIIFLGLGLVLNIKVF